MDNVNWSIKPQVIKGDFAENIVHDFLEKKGFIVYKPMTNAAHGFDRLAVKNKSQLIIAEVKAKARMNKYEATGIDLRHYNEYKKVQEKHNIPVWIFFVDELLSKIYGNWISELEKKITGDDGVEYPNTKIAKGIILFSLKHMKDVSNLTSRQCEYLKENSTRTYEYNILNSSTT